MKESDKIASDIFLEFLEVAIHNVIYHRQLYPATIFVRRKIYGIPVQCSIHPQLNSYITECMKGIQVLLKKNEVKKVIVVIYNKDSQPVEKFVFNVLGLYSGVIVSDTYFINTEESLRGVLLKLMLSNNNLKPLPEECTFAVQVHTTESASLSLTDCPTLQEDFPWIQTDSKSADVPDSWIVPVKDMDTDYLQLEVFVIESTRK